MLGPGENHDCRYIIYWPGQIGFLYQEQVNMNRIVNGSSVIIFAFPCPMQKWNGLENIRSFSKTLLSITSCALLVSLLLSQYLMAFRAAKDASIMLNKKARDFLLEFYPHFICCPINFWPKYLVSF